MCCSAAEIFAWPEDGTSMLPVVSRTTGQDERLLYQTWMTQFSEQDVLLRE